LKSTISISTKKILQNKLDFKSKNSELDKFIIKHGLAASLYKSGEPIFVEGGLATGVFYILKNHAHLYKINRSNESSFLYQTFPQEIIGITSFFENEKLYTHSAIVGELPCEAIFIANHLFIELLEQHSEIKYKLYSSLSNRINFLEMRSNHVLNHKTEENIIETLHFLTKHAGDDQSMFNEKEKLVRIPENILAKTADVSVFELRNKLTDLKNKGVLEFEKDWFMIKASKLI